MRHYKLIITLLLCSCIELKQPKYLLGQTVTTKTGVTGVIVEAHPGKADPCYLIRINVGNSINFNYKGITLQRGLQRIIESEIKDVK